MDEIRISSGAKSVNIVRDGVNVGVFTFNPKDVKEAQRHSEIVAEMEIKREKYIEKATELDKGNDAQAKIDFLAEFIADIYNDIDRIYGDGTSKMVFGDTLELDMISDFLRSLTPYYKTASEERTAKYKKTSSK